MRALALLLACACAASRPAPAPAVLACDALSLLGAAEPIAMASDAAGGLAVAGSFEGALRAGNATAASAGATDVFVLRTEPDGRVRWLHRIGGPGEDGASAVALSPEGESNCRALGFDAHGDVWVTGYFAGTLRGIASKGMYDLFVLKIAGATGASALVRAIGGKGKELPCAILPLASGSVLVAGQFGGEVDVSEADVDFGKGPVHSAGSYDGFLLSLAPDGKTQWAATFGDNGDDEINALALDASGAIYASGHHQPAGNYLGMNPHGVGNFTGVVLRYSADGRGEWVRIFEGPSSAANYLAFDENGRLWTGGASHGIRLDALEIPPLGDSDAFMLALDPRTGEALGARRWGSAAFDMTRGLARIPGGLAVTGLTGGEIDACGKPVGSPGQRTAFILWLRDLQEALQATG